MHTQAGTTLSQGHVKDQGVDLPIIEDVVVWGGETQLFIVRFKRVNNYVYD
jgi:hypothetical protein